MNHHRILWILQWVFGIYFIAVGINHFIVPEGLPSMMDWLYELNDTTHVIAGIAEIAGGLGLILPGLTKIRPELTVYAAEGLILVMLGALIWHVTRSEVSNLITNVIIAAILAYIAYGRSKLSPLSAKEPQVA